MLLFRRMSLVLASLFLYVGMALAQTTISGTVLSADDNEPLPGANVLVEGTKTRAITDIDGKFTLKDVKSNATLVVSMVGLRTEKVKAKNGMRILMQNEDTQMTEVVVTGVQALDKRLFTGAATKVNADDIKLSGIADVSRSLEGRVAGVQVTNVSGTFGAAPKIRVRGATSIYGNSKPLWVIDGVIYEDDIDVSADELSSGDAKTLISSAVAGLNSDDIESFTILKDGSATSIYGARAMAGVIVITTKKGAVGRNNVNYMGEFTTRFKPSYNEYNIMNSQEIMGVYKEMYDKGWLQLDHMVNAENTGIYGYMFQQLRAYDPKTGQFGLQNTEAARNAYLQAAEFRNTDWFDLLFTNRIQQNHSVSVSGGSEREQHYFSLSLYNDPGVYINRSSVSRYTFNGNMSFDILKGKRGAEKLTIRLAAQGNYVNQESPGTLDRSVDVVTGEVKRDFDINPYSYALNTSRCLDPNVSYTRFYTKFNIFDELEYNYIDKKSKELMLRAELEYKPIKEVSITGLIASRQKQNRFVYNVMDKSNQANAYRAGVDATDDNSTIRDNNPFLYTNPDDETALPESVLPDGGVMYQFDNNMRSNTFRLNASYNNVFKDKHTFNALAGTEYNSLHQPETKWTSWGYQYELGNNILTPYLWLKQINEENGEYFTDKNNWRNTLAFYSQVNYNFDQRYTLNGTFRLEGSNRLGKAFKSRWLPTWNVSGAYELTNEKFMEPTKSWLSQAKFRVSYSLTADTGPGDVTNALPVFKASKAWRPYTTATEFQIDLNKLGNDELTYEKKHEFNFGVDLSFLKDRIGLIFDVYKRNNFDLLAYCYTQGAGGEIRKWANVADMESHGVELSLSTINIDRAGFRWNSDFIFSKAVNEITNLKGDATQAMDLVVGTGTSQNHIEGYPRSAIFSYQFAGLNEEGLPQVINEKNEKTVGDVNFQETDNLTDFLVYEGPTDPTWYGSFNNTFSYKSKNWGKLTLDVFITYAGGNVVRLDPVFSSSYSDLSTMPREFKNRWMMAGDENVTNIPTIASRIQVDRYGSYTLRTAYNAYNYSTERIANGDFIRLKELALTYELPDSWLNKTYIHRASLKLAATNLCLLYADKKLNGEDPEFVNSGGVATPNTKQFTATVRLGF